MSSKWFEITLCSRNEEKTPLLIEFMTRQEGLTPVGIIPWPSRDKLEEKSNQAIDKAMTVMFNIESHNTSNSNLIGRQNVNSLECIYQEKFKSDEWRN
jgi:hypothetical protein